MASTDVTTVYRRIIDEVITKSRHDFVQEGVDEAILDELRVLWEEKLQQTGVLNPEPPRALPAGVPGTQVLHTGYMQPPSQSYTPGYYTMQTRAPTQLGRPANYMAPASTAMGYPGQISSQAATHPQHLPSYAAQSHAQLQQQQPAQQLQARMQMQGGSQMRPAQQAPASQQAHAQGLYQFIQSLQAQQQIRPASQTAPPHQYQAVKYAQAAPQAHLYPQMPTPNQYQQQYRPPQSMSQQQAMPAQYVRTGMTQPQPGHTGYVQQQAGVPNNNQNAVHDDASRKRKAEEAQVNSRNQPPGASQPMYGAIPQRDGPADGVEAAEDKDGKEGDGEAPVDNLSDVPSSDDDEEEEVPNHCISQYTKVTRTKNRWKANLLAGIMHLNGRDHCFHSALGEFTF